MVQTEVAELTSAALMEHVVVFEVVASSERGGRMWAWCFIDLAKGYGWQRVGWTTPGGGEDLGDLGASLDWGRERGGSNPVLLFEYDTPALGAQ